MKADILVENLTFSKIYEIFLQPIPNMEFDTTINDNSYDFIIRTLADNMTYITISKDGVCLCNMANIKTGVDLIFTSIYDDGVFFFANQTDEQLAYINYEHFNTKVKLYYAIF